MRTLRIQRTTFALSILMFLLGVVCISLTIWKTWPAISSAQNPLSAFMALLGKEKFSLVPGFEFELTYLFALGDALLILGVIFAAFGIQRLYLPGEVVWYRCPFCHKDWRSSGDKGLVHCPHCRQLGHPTLIEKKK